MEPAATLAGGGSEPESTSNTAVPSDGTNTPNNGGRSSTGGGNSSGDKATDDTCDQLKARVFELENRLRETEEELEFYFEFFKKAKRGGQASGTSSKQQQRQQEQQQQSSSKVDQRDDDTDDSDLDGEAPSNANYTGETTNNAGTNIFIHSSSTIG